MNHIPLVALPADTPTSYLPGGGTRLVGGAVPHLSMVRTVGQIGGGNAWRLTPASAAALAAVQAELVGLGCEPTRLTEAFRDPATQANARASYDAWVRAGRPEPGRVGWVAGMKTAYVTRAGESNHGWGAATDIDVGALQMPKVARGSDAALSLWWEIAAPHGWTPIIARPDVHQSECWHFDHLGPLRAVLELYQDAGRNSTTYRGIEHAQTSRCGAALAGTLPQLLVPDLTAAHIQARLNLAGHFCGLIDGQLGAMSRSALKSVGITATSKTKSEALLVELDAAGIALAQIAEA